MKGAQYVAVGSLVDIPNSKIFLHFKFFDSVIGGPGISYQTVLANDYMRLTYRGNSNDSESDSFSSDFWIS